MAVFVHPVFVDRNNKIITKKYLYAISKFKADKKPETVSEFYLGDDGCGYYPDNEKKSKLLAPNLYYFYLTRDKKKLKDPLSEIKQEDCYGKLAVAAKKKQKIKLAEVKTFFGARLTVQEFNIKGRKQDISLGMVDWKKKAADVHKKAGQSFEVNNKKEYKPKLMMVEGNNNNDLKKYKLDGLAGKCVISRGMDFNKSPDKCNEKGDASCDKKLCEDYTNDFITKEIGLRIKRDKTFKLKTSGLISNNFGPAKTESVANLIETDKVCYKIFLFLRMRSSGMDDTYYEVKADGALEKINPDNFTKQSVKDFIKDQDGSIMEGVQQYHILIEQVNNSSDVFQIREAYCDGDRIL